MGSSAGVHGWDSSAVPQPQSTENTSHHHNSSSYYIGQQVGCRAPAGHAGDGKHREGPRAQTGNRQITRATCLEDGGPVQRKPPTGRPGSSHLRTRKPVRSADQWGFGSDHAPLTPSFRAESQWKEAVGCGAQASTGGQPCRDRGFCGGTRHCDTTILVVVTTTVTQRRPKSPPDRLVRGRAASSVWEVRPGGS